MRTVKKGLFAALIAAALVYITSVGAPIAAGAEDINELSEILSGMSLRQKVGQLFIVRPDALGGASKGATKLTDAMKKTLAKYPVGGVAMFKKNITSPKQIKQFTRALNDASDIGMFISIDEEGGSVARIAGNVAFDVPKYKSAWAVGAGGDAQKALEMGRTIGGYLMEYGFNMDFAPVADVLTNASNTVIGKRAFSSDAKIAAQMAGAMAQGLRSQGVVPVFKHFPGHGDTLEDSHAGIAVNSKSKDELESCEWLPFAEAGPSDGVMVGHIAVPQITGGLTPASMSPALVSALRNDVGFEGLIITDALEMGAVTASYTSAEAALGALNAGCDVLLMPSSMKNAFDAVVTAVESGQFSEKRLDEIVLRVLQFKSENGIL